MPSSFVIQPTSGVAVRGNPGISLGHRIAGEGIPTTQANRGLGGITTIPCPTPAASTPHSHGKGIACSTTSSSSSKPRWEIDPTIAFQKTDLKLVKTIVKKLIKKNSQKNRQIALVKGLHAQLHHRLHQSPGWKTRLKIDPILFH